MESLDGEIAVITGAARGIGQGIALRFALEGAKSAVVDTLGEKLAQVVDTIHEQGGKAIGIEADITSSLQIDQFVSRAIEHFGRIDILVNAISPGLIETDMTRHKLSDPQKKRNFIQEIPLGRPGHPSDIAGAAVFLASNDSDFITGHNLVVDGGQSCKIS